MFDFIIKGGNVIDPANNIRGTMDIGVKDGKIAAVAPELGGCDNIVDATGKMVMPGGIDSHLHLRVGYSGYPMVARTGITTAIDLCGPLDTILGAIKGGHGCGLNIAVVDMIEPDKYGGPDVSKETVDNHLNTAMEHGALGIKLLGGHYPLTPKASAYAIEAANKAKVMISFHVGTTENRSNLLGVREAVELCGDNAMILPHVNAYCRGAVLPSYMDEVVEMFHILRTKKNIISDSHLAVPNACTGLCTNGEIHDVIVKNCLKQFGYDATPAALEQAILNGVAKVYKVLEDDTILIEREEALEYWKAAGTNCKVSFPANLDTVACLFMLEREKKGGEFLVPSAVTDGGFYARNDLIFRALQFYHLGYISLEDVVKKVSLNPARLYNLVNKGHLGVGADADITIVDLPRSRPVMSFAMGKMIMKDGSIVGKGATMLVTDAASAFCKKNDIAYDVVDVTGSTLYKK